MQSRADEGLGTQGLGPWRASSHLCLFEVCKGIKMVVGMRFQLVGKVKKHWAMLELGWEGDIWELPVLLA